MIMYRNTVLSLIVLLSLQNTQAMLSIAVRTEIDAVYQSAYTNLSKIVLIGLGWKFCAMHEPVSAEVANNHGFLFNQLYVRLVELLKQRGIFVEYSPRDVLHACQMVRALTVSIDEQDPRLWGQTLNYLRTWDNDLTETLKQIQGWLGLLDQDFITYVVFIQKWFLEMNQDVLAVLKLCS